MRSVSNENIKYDFFTAFHIALFAQNTMVPISANVEMYNGKPTIMLNGKPRNPMFYVLIQQKGNYVAY
ncbi:hypothetical protein BH11BAC6_BH11BAC6_02240 [soil metagenome]